MTLQQLDLVAPFVMFFCGAFICIAWELSLRVEGLAQKIDPYLLSQFKRNLPIAHLCLWFGGLWSLQNIWFNSL